MKKLLWLLLPLLFFSCGSPKYTVLNLVSDNPEVLLLVEFTHTQKNELRIIPHYKKHLVPDNLEDYDIVVSADIAALPMLEKLHSSKKTSLDTNELYSWASVGLNQGKDMIPLSFDLSVLLYREDQFSPSTSPFMLHPKEIETWATLDPPGEKGYTKIGFSPLWNVAYIRFLLENRGEDFSENGVFSYDPTLLKEVLDSQRIWLENNDREAMKSFDNKYRYIPDLELLRNGKVDFIQSSLSEFLSYQESSRKGLDFSLLAENHLLRPENVIYAGISDKTQQIEIAEKILILWTDAEFQKEYMNWKKQLREDSFGFLGGFSTIEKINHFELSRYYRELESRFVQDIQFMPPSDIPLHWSALTQEVLDPWLLDSLGPGEFPELDAYYKEWELHYIPD